jgi:hypothetical protein
VLTIGAVVLGIVSLRRPRAGVIGLVVLGTIGALAAVTRPSNGLLAAVPSIVGAAAGLWAFVWLRGRAGLPQVIERGREPEERPAAPAGLDRRSFLFGSAVAAGLAVATGFVGEYLVRRADATASRSAVRLPEIADIGKPTPAGADLHVPGELPFITPNDDFYRVDTALFVPAVQTEGWTLSVGGMVDRPLTFGPPPDEEVLTIQYVDQQGQARQINLTWSVSSFAPGSSDGAAGPAALDAPHGFDVEGVQVARLRTVLFAPEFIAAETSGEPVVAGPEGISVSPQWSTVFEARKVTAAGQVFGHLRIRGFVPPASVTNGVSGFVREFIRLLGELPPDGLAVDIRGNLGGAILASELGLQALTARPVEPEPAQFAATALNLRICRANESMAAWLPSMEQALETGAAYSAAVPFTPQELLAEVPQSYFGPVILITDARCYSAGRPVRTTGPSSASMATPTDGNPRSEPACVLVRRQDPDTISSAPRRRTSGRPRGGGPEPAAAPPGGDHERLRLRERSPVAFESSRSWNVTSA